MSHGSKIPCPAPATNGDGNGKGDGTGGNADGGGGNGPSDGTDDLKGSGWKPKIPFTSIPDSHTARESES